MKNTPESFTRYTEFCERECTFYKNIKGCSLADFPVINKQMILADRDAFLTPEELIPGQNGNCIFRLHLVPREFHLPYLKILIAEFEE